MYRALILTFVSTVWGLSLFAGPVLASSYPKPLVTRVSAGPADATIRAIFFQPGGRHGVVGGTNRLLAYTNDGGERWHDSEIVWKDPKEAQQNFDILRIKPLSGTGADSSDGISFNLVAIGGPYILLSMDGGAKWIPLKKVRLSETGSRPVRLEPYLVGVDINSKNNGQFLVSQVAMVKNRYEFKRSALVKYSLNYLEDNVGSPIVPLPSDLDGTEFTDLYLNQRDLLLVGTKGQILVTDGRIWEYPKSPTQETLLDVVFPSSKRGWIVGKKATILSTNDGGFTWKSVEARNPPGSEDYRAIQFIDPCRGWIVGHRGLLLYSQEKRGEVVWTATTSGTTVNLYAVALSRSRSDRPKRFNYEVWAAGENKTLVKLFVTGEERCGLR
jgi:photosystem II stability/assembly factor-like uncharacterized protein